MMCNKIILDLVRADSESAALDAAVSPSSLVPDMSRVLCWHSPVFQMLLLEEFLKCLVLMPLRIADFSSGISFWNQKQQLLCTAQCVYQPVLYTRSVHKMLPVNLSSASRLKSLCWRCVPSRSSGIPPTCPSHSPAGMPTGLMP